MNSQHVDYSVESDKTAGICHVG